jgi:hypothetical protein
MFVLLVRHEDGAIAVVQVLHRPGDALHQERVRRPQGWLALRSQLQDPHLVNCHGEDQRSELRKQDVEVSDERCGGLLGVKRLAGGNDHALACLLARNALRVSEACGAELSDLAVANGHRVVRIVGKGNQPALIPLAPRRLDPSTPQSVNAPTDHCWPARMALDWTDTPPDGCATSGMAPRCLQTTSGSNSATAAGTSQSYGYPSVWGATHGMEGVVGLESHPVHHPHAARTPASTAGGGSLVACGQLRRPSRSRHDPQCALLPLPAVGSRPDGVVPLGHGQQTTDGGEAGAVRRRCAGERRE